MTRGNAVSDTVVIFTHTTYELSGIPGYYKMFYDWNPSFYAVQLERPGDVTTKAIACNAGGMATCVPPEDSAQVDCTGQYLELLKWLHLRIGYFKHRHPKVVLAGISYGGVWFEDYIRWRARMGDENAVRAWPRRARPLS